MGQADDPTGLVIIPAFVSSAPGSGAQSVGSRTFADQGSQLSCVAFGVLESWCFRRHFLDLGMNDGGRGRRVFDGVIITPPASARYSRTIASAEAAHDPRPSIEERYGSGQNYVPEIEAAAAALVDERRLLPADAEVYVETAKACDKF
jgi:hypothetical protein